MSHPAPSDREQVQQQQQHTHAVPCSLNPSHRASFCCLDCSKYLCATCDYSTHSAAGASSASASSASSASPASPASSHTRVAVASMRAFVAVDEAHETNETPPRRHWATRLGPIQAPLSASTTSSGAGQVLTLYDNFQRSARLFASRACLGTRQVDGSYTFVTYAQVAERVSAVGSGLRALGYGRRTVVGLYARNCPEWVVVEQACYAQSYLPVPLYDTLGVDAAQFVLAQADVAVVVCSRDKLDTLFAVARSGKVPSLRHVIVLPPQPCDGQLPTPPAGPSTQPPESLTVLDLGELERRGREKPFAHTPPQPTDLATMCYTSGTTGTPKGAMLTHASFVSDVAAVIFHGVDVGPDDVHISFLPLAHNFERLVTSLMLSVGGAIGYYRGDPTLLVDDVAALRPTLFVAVPRLYNRLYDRIMSVLRSGSALKKWLVERALSTKLHNLREHGQLTHMIWDRLVFSKVAARLGGRVRLMVTGSAPISSTVLDFLRVAFSCPVVEGYGMTETTAAATVTPRDDVASVGNVGVPLVCNEIKLVDVPEMNYTVRDRVDGRLCPRGEVWVRGTNIFKGYFKMQDKTDETLTDDGWCQTGDIAMFLPDQTLRIIDRKKNIFKLAQGEYIAPDKIEQAYCRSRYIAQMFVYGDSLRSSLVAIVVPDEEEVRAHPVAAGSSATPFDQLLQRAEVVGLVTESMRRAASEAKLHGFERVKAFHLEAQQFSVENGILTPTFKLKRNVARDHYQERIAELYAQVGDELKSRL